MRITRVRAFAHRQLQGRTHPFDDRPGLVTEHADRLAAAVADHTRDPLTVAAVHVYALTRYGGWRRPRLLAAGIDPRLIDAAEAVRAEAAVLLRLSAKSLARGALIRDCRHAVLGTADRHAGHWAWQRARADLARHGAPDAAGVRRLIADLESADPETFLYAREMLDQVRPAAAVEPLLAAAERIDPAEGLNRRLALTLTAFGCMTPAHLPLALRLLAGPGHQVRSGAAGFLRRLDDPAARAAVAAYDLEQLRALLGLAEDEPTPRQPPEISRRLVAVITAGRPSLDTFGALHQYGDASALPALTAVLGHPLPWMQRAADRAIEAIGGAEARRRAALAVLRDPDAGHHKAAYVAGLLGLAEAVPELIAIVRSDHDPARHEAVMALGRLGATEAVPALIDAFHRFARLRQTLVPALLRLDPEPAVDLLLAEARSTNADYRELVLNALARCTDRRATDLVVTVLLHGAVRPALVAPLAERSDPELLGLFVELVNTTSSRKIRLLATHGIRRIAAADPALVQRSIHSIRDETSRAWLEPWLPDGPERLKRLAEAARKDDRRVRAQAVKSLAAIGGSEALAVIRQLREDPSRHVRACVAGVLRGRAPISDR
ncbi:HEAT repeat domain-containing protein [Kitasatospora sp. NPDC004531]